MDDIEYWKECIEIAADECGAELTHSQLDDIADSVKCGHEHYGMAFYQPPASDHYKEQIAKLERELERERKAVFCTACGGTGESVSHGPHHSASSSCSKCWGVGKIYEQ